MVSSPVSERVPADPASGRSLFILGWVALGVAYVLVFSLTGEPPVRALGLAAANVLPAALLGVLVARGVSRFLVGRPWPEAVVWHLALGTAFVGLWYGLLIPSLAIAGWLDGGELVLRPLTGPALPWQIFQGAMIYAVVAVAAHAFTRSCEPAPAHSPQPVGPLTRYLMRRGDEIVPVEVDAIISIRGADDYAEVTTAAGVHLARMTLQAFAEALPQGRFVRVHRSWIVNFDRLARAEPTGDGRLLLHLDDGRTLTTSRAGAALLRGRLV